MLGLWGLIYTATIGTGFASSFLVAQREKVGSFSALGLRGLGLEGL